MKRKSDFWKSHKNDAVLILALLLFAGGVWAYTLLTRRAGGAVEITVDGETVAALPLSEDRVYTWSGERGSNTLSIENGAACMAAADCPDGICIGRGRVRYAGETIICLPHKLVVTVTEGEAAPWDAVSG